MSLRVAAAQLSVSSAPADNLVRAKSLIGDAVGQGAKFVALPECFTGKYEVERFRQHRKALFEPARGLQGLSSSSLDAKSEFISGSQIMSSMASRQGIWVTGGVIEDSEGGQLYNSIPIYAPDGRLHATYRKVHLSRSWALLQSRI